MLFEFEHQVAVEKVELEEQVHRCQLTDRQGIRCTSKFPTVMGLLSDIAVAMHTVADVPALFVCPDQCLVPTVLLFHHQLFDQIAQAVTPKMTSSFVCIPRKQSISLTTAVKCRKASCKGSTSRLNTDTLHMHTCI